MQFQAPPGHLRYCLYHADLAGRYCSTIIPAGRNIAIFLTYRSGNAEVGKKAICEAVL